MCLNNVVLLTFKWSFVLSRLFVIKKLGNSLNISARCKFRRIHRALSSRASGFRENAGLPKLHETNQSVFSGFSTRNIRDKTKDFLNMSNINLLHANLDFIKSKPMLVVTINNSLKDTERKVFYTDTPFLVGFSAPLLISCKITCNPTKKHSS